MLSKNKVYISYLAKKIISFESQAGSGEVNDRSQTEPGTEGVGDSVKGCAGGDKGRKGDSASTFVERVESTTETEGRTFGTYSDKSLSPPGGGPETTPVMYKPN